MRDLHFYVDDSGTRHPDKRNPNAEKIGDWFGLGGILVSDVEEVTCRRLHAEFCARWNIEYPLHSSDIRFKSGNFKWLKAAPLDEANRFYTELEKLITSVPVLALACVIDRPGYNARYHEMYGRQKWSLCKTAFSVIAERAAKRARSLDLRLRIMPERADVKADARLKGYFTDLRSNGMPFREGGDPKYRPLSQAELKETLLEFRPKFKSSPMVQLADLYLYPVCRAGYLDYRPMSVLREHGKLIDSVLDAEDVPTLGIKYSCFERVTGTK